MKLSLKKTAILILTLCLGATPTFGWEKQNGKVNEEQSMATQQMHKAKAGPSIPAIDARAPQLTETASFALG